MHPTNQFRRTLAEITVGAHRSFQRRERQASHYELAERTHEFQFPIKGTLGRLPSEGAVKVLFDIMFIYEYGYRRDSQLNEPQTHFGFTSVSAPPATVLSAHVESWVQDHDFNFIGANVVVTAHNPTMAMAGTAPVTLADFKATLHCSFHGYGLPIDPDEPQDNGSIGNTPPANETGTVAPRQNAGNGTPPPVVRSDPPQPVKKLTVTTKIPDYPAGPLGSDATWTTVATWDAGGALSDFDVPAGEAALKVATDDGRLTAHDPLSVQLIGPPGGRPNIDTPYLPIPGPNWITVPQGKNLWYVGDKYAAIWSAPSKVADKHKIRAHLLLNPTGNDYLMQVHSIVVNMRDRRNGLAFFFGTNGIGWTDDLRMLGTVQAFARVFAHGQSLDRLRYYSDAPFNAWNHNASFDPLFHRDVYDEDQGFANYQLSRDFQSLPEVWVELWRSGTSLIAALYKSDPAGGAKPAYMSSHHVATSDTNYGLSARSHFGWTTSHITWGGSPGTVGGSYNPTGYPKRGIKSLILMKES